MFQDSNRSRGLTLVETLIASALLGMMMTGLYFTLVLSLRYQARVHDTADTFQRGLTVTTRLTTELGYGAASSLRVEPEGIAFLSARPVSGPFTHDVNGQVEWHRTLFFYLDGTELHMGEFEIPATTTISVPPDLATLRADSRASTRLLAKGVTNFTVTGGSGSDIFVRVQGEDDATNAVTLNTRVTFRQ